MCSDIVAKVLLEAAVLMCCSMSVISCSVEEDRTDCPCFLTLDFSSMETSMLREKGVDSLRIGICDGEGFYVRESWALDEYVQEYSVAVPKTMMNIGVVCANGGIFDARNGYLIPEGHPCPAVFLQSGTIDTECEGMVKSVSLHKNWCKLEVHMKTADFGVVRPFKVELEGDVCGYALDGSLIHGPFSCTSGTSSLGHCSVSVPRQDDGSLWLRVIFTDSGEIRGFPVGEYIIASGYDWEADDLEDVSVEMDFTTSGVTFTISSWKKTMYFEMTI